VSAKRALLLPERSTSTTACCPPYGPWSRSSFQRERLKIRGRRRRTRHRGWSDPGRLVALRQLLQEVWGPTYGEQTHYLRQDTTTLRRKLEPDPSRPQHLLTEVGMGSGSR